jgi:excisionase family DNA binding protein
MTTLTHDRTEPLRASADEHQAFLRLVAALPDVQDVQLLVNGVTVPMPRTALLALAQLSQCLARGERVALVHIGKDLRTQDAADLLGVSRPHIVKLCERGELPFHMAGNQRRIGYDALIAYKQRRSAARRIILDEMTQLGEEIDAQIEAKTSAR